ncbi:hypothetical protein ACQJBY_042151 [Aegilops geniculata]
MTRRGKRKEHQKARKSQSRALRLLGACVATKGHNKTCCNKNPEKGKKKNAFLKKTRKKIKATKEAKIDAQIRVSQEAKSKGKDQVEAGTSGSKRKATRKKIV